MKKIGLLGASGSIGSQALDVMVRDRSFELAYFSVHYNIDRAKQIIDRFMPEYALISSERRSLLGDYYRDTKILGLEDLELLIKNQEADIVLNSMMGMSGLASSWWVLEAGLKLALANKESLVSAGGLLKALEKKHGGSILPVDSEHSALWQCMEGENKGGVEKLILTASGGAFRDYSLEDMLSSPASCALKHPNWSMGKKITIDSATLMNKGLEVIEAYWLFGIPLDKIEVLIHRESIVHSLVQYQDGSLLAQMGIADMRQPIHYALHEKRREALNLPRLDLAQLARLTFEKVDPNKYPSLAYCRQALEEGGNRPLILNTINEVMVEKYLKDEINLRDLFQALEDSFKDRYYQPASLEDLLEEEARIRSEVE